MGFEDYKQHLLAPDFDVNIILDTYFHSGQSFVFLDQTPDSEPSFRRQIARSLNEVLGIQFHLLELVVCGSAHLGFSPVPSKMGQRFDPSHSDIDLAVVCESFFNSWWSELQQVNMTPADRLKVADDLFWGFINPSSVKQFSVTGRKWWSVFAVMQTNLAQSVRGRVYRDFWSMENYHRRVIQMGRDHLLNRRP